MSKRGTRFGELIEWLQEEKNLQERSARDVRSHLKRAEKFVDLSQSNLDGDDLAYLLNKNPEFSNLSTSVRSHLRRAVRLLKEFERVKKKKLTKDLFEE